LNVADCHVVTALTTKLSKPFYDYDFSGLQTSESLEGAHIPKQMPNIALVFGSETAGLVDDIRENIGADNWLRLPMLADSRSLNLSNSVAICLYEIWRQQGFAGDEGRSVGYETLTVYDPK